MLITRRSPFSGVERTRDLSVTKEEIDRWRGGEFVQHVWPNLSPDDREFIMTGISPQEWDENVPKEEEDD